MVAMVASSRNSWLDGMLHGKWKWTRSVRGTRAEKRGRRKGTLRLKTHLELYLNLPPTSFPKYHHIDVML
jgi:hypothetical protein